MLQSAVRGDCGGSGRELLCVTSGCGAALVASALEREMRRQLAERDAELLVASGATDDLDDLVAWTASHTELSD